MENELAQQKPIHFLHMVSAYKIIVVGIVILLSCSTQKKSIFKNSENGILIHKEPLENFAGNYSRNLSCESQGIQNSIKAVRDSKSKNIVIHVYSSYRGSSERNLERTIQFAQFIDSCLNYQLGNFYSIEAKGFGETIPYIIEKDTTIDKIHFKRGSKLIERDLNKIDKRKANYFEPLINRVEIYSRD